MVRIKKQTPLAGVTKCHKSEHFSSEKKREASPWCKNRGCSVAAAKKPGDLIKYSQGVTLSGCYTCTHVDILSQQSLSAPLFIKDTTVHITGQYADGLNGWSGRCHQAVCLRTAPPYAGLAVVVDKEGIGGKGAGKYLKGCAIWSENTNKCI